MITCDDYEKLGAFYLGKRYDHEKQAVTDELVLYDSSDLVTHAVCVGMTGSGKTGLCISMLEEAAIDQIPVIAIDPKGDLSNLLLTFPDLSAKSFEPWVSQDEARRQGLSATDLASNTAKKWQDGLAKWHQSPERIARLREAAEFAIYTPASTAGRPISVLGSFKRPSDDLLDDAEMLREYIGGTVTGLLTLLELDADPLKSREHILLSAILQQEWQAGAEPGLADLISLIQTPPIKSLGAVPLESFFPSKERYQFAMTLNNLLAAPGFQSWMEGEPLDIDKLLWSESGKPRVSILSIAHLDDGQRMFFVGLLLNQLLTWMRRQSGTTSLRAIFYMDEIHGYFPPVANPPTKKPLLTLLKQARAFGLGIMLATQNPVDLDYKGLSNCGTWFLGRLQTERDKMRVLEGLESAAQNAGQSFDRQDLDRLLSGLSTRVFLMNNVHENGPVLFMTRWSLSYLKGPLSRQELKTLNKAAQGAVIKIKPPAAPDLSDESSGARAPVPATSHLPSPAPARSLAPAAGDRLVLPSEIKQRFAPVRADIPADARLVYKPMLYAQTQVRFTDSSTGTDHLKDTAMLTLLKESQLVSWEKSFQAKLRADALNETPQAGIEFASLPQEAAVAATYPKWSKELLNWLYTTQKLEVLRCAVTKMVSAPGENERDFRIRLAQTTHEERDREVANLRAKFADKLATLEDKLMRARQTLDREEAQAKQHEMDTNMAVGSSILGALMGRKVVSSTNIRRASSVAGKAARAAVQRQQAEQASEVVISVEEKMAQLEHDLQVEMAALKSKIDPYNCQLEQIMLTPKKTNINLVFFCLCWAPCVRQPDGRITLAW